MEQRPLRLGDIVDDYCPRERRITNHAIVAIVEDSVRQTRCTTCDSEHVYKEAREPRRRKIPGSELVPPEPAVRPATPRPLTAAADSPVSATGSAASSDDAPSLSGELEDPEPRAGSDDAWPAHRQLIRATLPRTEGEPPAPRPIPEFTMHQRQGRSQGFRYSQPWNGHGNGPERGHGADRGNGNGFRQGRPAFGNGRGPASGPPQGSGQGQPPGGGRRRRRRHKSR
jgi:hypothetical protein